jgi:alpha-amylase/alpha-mannosidase (GH57 family)
MTTFSDIVAKCKTPELASDYSIDAKVLPAIAAGSWVYGTFSTWIGSTEKNNAWDLLCKAKKAYDQVVHSSTLSPDELTACERQLSICEGSDWFWWFGDYNSSVSVQSFDRLYRRNLSNLYRLLKLEAPASLGVAISSGGGDPAVGGTMRRGQE